jgi:hypothetical protein
MEMNHARTAWLNVFLSCLCWLIASTVTVVPQAQLFSRNLVATLSATTVILMVFAVIFTAASQDHWLNKSAHVRRTERAITIVLLLVLVLGVGG